MHKRQARTIRRMPPHTRQIAKWLNDLQTLVDRLDFKLSSIQNIELEARALVHAKQSVVCPACGRTAHGSQFDDTPDYTTENIDEAARNLAMRQAAIDTGFVPSLEDEEYPPPETPRDEAEHQPKPFNVPKPPVNLPPL